MALPILILDLSTAPIAGVEHFLVPANEREAPENYKKEEAIARFQQESFSKDVTKAGLDANLAQITGCGLWCAEMGLKTAVNHDGSPEGERLIIERLGDIIKRIHPAILTYNGLSFDLPMLIRRAQYLDIDFPFLSLDRYRTDHIDVLEHLTYHGRLTSRSLEWYAKRLKLEYVKPLSGKEEAEILESKRWDELKLSLRHDVMALHAVARKFKIANLPADITGAAVPPPPEPPVG